MKRMIACFLLAGICNAMAELVPDTLTLRWSRSDVSAYADTTNVYLSGVTYRLTNCQALVSSAISTNVPAVAQSLTNCTITLRVGDAGTNIAYAGHCGSYTDLTNGVFSADIRFPRWTLGSGRSATGQEGIELTITDTNSAVVFTYKARKLFTVMQPLY